MLYAHYHVRTIEGRAGPAQLRQAFTIARCQHARSWELRIAISLGRLWQQQGKRDEASELLTALHNWFTKGFNTLDLQEAKVLLQELTGGMA